MKLSSQLFFRLQTIFILSIVIAVMSVVGVFAETQTGGGEASQSTPPVDSALQFAVKLPDARFDSEHPAQFDLPALPARAGLKPVLRLRMVVQTSASAGTKAGFGYNSRIVINGVTLQRLTNRKQERLLMRPEVLQLLSNGNPYGVFQEEWLATMFAHNADIGDSMTADGRGATFTFDLSDVARGVDGNSLEIRGKMAPGALKDHVGTEEGNGIGHATDIEVGYLPQNVSSSPTIPLPLRLTPQLCITRAGVRLEVSNRGGFAVEYQESRLIVETNLGIDHSPHDDLVAEDRPMSTPPATGMAIVTVKPAGSGFDVTAVWNSGNWAGLALKRQLRLTGDGRIEWREHWSNSALHDVVVPFNHLFYLQNESGHNSAARPLLGGNPEMEFTASDAANPTIFLGTEAAGKAGSAGFGWVAEDDWMRALFQMSRDGKSAQVQSRNLALAPGKSIDFTMSIDTQPTSSYWDFINALRRRWKVNDVTIDRAFVWGTSKEAIKDHGALTQVVSPWLGLQFDTAAAIALDKKYGEAPVPDEELRRFYTYEHREAIWKELHDSVAKMHKEVSDVQVWPMMHPSMEVVYKPKLELYPFHGEEILDAKGQPFFDPRYSRSWLPGANTHGWEVLYIQPSDGSKYQTELIRRIDDAFKKADMDGIYCDEFTFAGARQYSRYDYRSWDGYSVVLDSDGNIKSKVTDNAISTIPNQLSMIAAVKSHHKKMLVNMAPASRAVQNAGIYHFAEAGNGLWQGATLHLTTPLTLGNVVDTPKTSADVLAISRRLLLTGNLHVAYGYYNVMTMINGEHNFITEQFPITPQTLGAGFVTGPQRIVTCVSHNFNIGSTIKMYRLWQYDNTGKLLQEKPEVTKVKSGQRVLELKVPENGLTIAELLTALPKEQG
jgi:hypothetical protein